MHTTGSNRRFSHSGYRLSGSQRSVSVIIRVLKQGIRNHTQPARLGSNDQKSRCGLTIPDGKTQVFLFVSPMVDDSHSYGVGYERNHVRRRQCGCGAGKTVAPAS